MTEVEKSIHEKSDKINKVRKIIKQRAVSVDSIPVAQEELSTADWKAKAFACPDNTVQRNRGH